MSSLLETLARQLGGDELKQIGRQLGTDEQTAKNATGAALSTLIGALARNSARDDGAAALHRAIGKDHDGSLLDNLSGFLGSGGQSAVGEGILRHVLGARQPQVEQGLGRTTGLDSASIGKLLALLAPVVLGALGKQQRQNGLAAGDLSNLLGQERRRIESGQPQAAGLIGSLLDTDGDGDVDISDIAKHGAGILGKLFGGR